MDNRSRKCLWLLIIIDYQNQSIIDGNRSINVIVCYQSITYSVKHFNCQFHRVLINLHILISLLFIWEFHREDGGGRGRLHRHIKKEEEKEITISSIVFERRLRPRSVESLQINSKLNRSSLYNWQRDMFYCLNYLCCFSRSHIDEQFSNFATEV